jgi:nucleoid-associated protein YgaU
VASRERENALLIEERFRNLSGRIETLEMEMAAQRREWERARERTDAAGDAQRRALEERTAALERRLVEMEAAREKDRQEIIDVLSRRMAELLQATAPAAGRSSVAARRGEQSGWEHEVKPGESLSAIAAAYGVRVADIVAANQLKDADRIRAGQKLFIPAP